MWDLVGLACEILFPGRSSSDERALPSWIGWTMLALLLIAVGVLIWLMVFA